MLAEKFMDIQLARIQAMINANATLIMLKPAKEIQMRFKIPIKFSHVDFHDKIR